MADTNTGPSRPRALSEAARPQTTTHHVRESPTRSTGGGRLRRTSRQATTHSTFTPHPVPRRRSTGFTFQTRSGRLPSLGLSSASRYHGLGAPVPGGFSLAGPGETAHDPFVDPGYAELNPEYVRGNPRPVWSLAKPLPRVVRGGMAPDWEEALEMRERGRLSRQEGDGDVDLGELEAGRIGETSDPRKMARRVDSARVQREGSFVDRVLEREGDDSVENSRASSTGVRHSSAFGDGSVDTLFAVPEGEDYPGEHADDTAGAQDLGEQQHHAVPEETPLLGPNHKHTADSAIEEPIPDEIHNNHTVWSVIRTHHREAIAESLAVFTQITIGICADLSVTLSGAESPSTTAWAWGLATMMAIYISGGVSGAHLNPAITCMLWFYRGFPKRKIPAYIAAQFLAAFVAGLVAYGVYHESINDYLTHSPSPSATTNIINSFITNHPPPKTPTPTPQTTFLNELLGTLLLTSTILALGDDQNAPPTGGTNAAIIGLTVSTLSLTFSYQSGAALNPSRDCGPRLALLVLGYGSEALFKGPRWVCGPWAGATCGAFLGAFLYDFLVFTGGESPVNYPWERVVRVWRRGLRVGKNGEKGVRL
ncbi:aquaporin-like protein [Aspergillus aurantiobrunneus]